MKSIVDQASEILSKEEELTLADYKKFIKLQDMAKTEAGLWIFWDEKGKKVYENKFNEIELSVDLMIIDDLGKLRVAGCSEELVKKFGDYIF